MDLLEQPFRSFLRLPFFFFLALIHAHPSSAASAHQQNPAPSSDLSVLQSRADHGDAVAQYRLAEIYLRNYSSSDYKKVISLARASAAQGNADGEFLLGYLFEHGQGVSKDYAKAAENYRGAALKGHSNAANNLASLYQQDHAVPKNFGLAFDWYLASAQHGNPVGQANLASLYFTGVGTPRDYVLPATWFRPPPPLPFSPAHHALRFFHS